MLVADGPEGAAWERLVVKWIRGLPYLEPFSRDLEWAPNGGEVQWKGVLGRQKLTSKCASSMVTHSYVLTGVYSFLPIQPSCAESP